MTEHIQFSEIKQALLLLDQRILPGREEYFTCADTEDVIYALQTMVVRGAPAIGVTAAYGCWLALRQAMAQAGPGWRVRLDELLRGLENARPTAVNLRWAVELMRAEAKAAGDIGPDALSERWLAKAKAVHAEDIEINKAMGRFGAAAIDDGDTVMTHCNAGPWPRPGTARPWGSSGPRWSRQAHQGHRQRDPALFAGRAFTATSWPRTASTSPWPAKRRGHLMKKGMVQKVVVGADRIAANGDAANKIGTYTVALAAKAHGVPFYVAAPASTFALRIRSGDQIPIENRTPREVTHIGDPQITPEGVPVLNYAFDVTPAELIAGIATEKGLLRAPYAQAIKEKIGSA
jgi:methylthioribose-1-phosphate isomerase